MSLFQRNKADTDAILKSFPDAQKRLFQTYLSDVTTATGQPAEGAFWAGINKVTDVANILNRTLGNISGAQNFLTTTQENAALVHQAARAAEALSGRANDLQRAVGAFKLD